MNLAELQSDFQKAILDPKATSVDWVSECENNLSSKARIGIYHNAYRIRLIDTLYDTFEHTANYLGSHWFETLAASYVESNVSLHPNLGVYGKAFAHHLEQQLPNDMEVAELAQMDWSLRRAFDGANADAITREVLAAQAAAGGSVSHFSPVPTLSVINQHFNTLDIWHAINLEKTPPTVEKLAEPANILIWRKGHSPHFRSISKMETAAIERLSNGADFEEIGEALYASFPEADVVAEFGLMIARWLDDELLTQ